MQEFVPSFPVPAGFRAVPAETTDWLFPEPVRVISPDPPLTVSFEPIDRVVNDWFAFEIQFPPEGMVDVLAQFLFKDGNVFWQRMPALDRNHFLAHFRLPGELQRATLLIMGSGRIAEPVLCRFYRVGIFGQLVAAARRGFDVAKRDGFGVMLSAVDYFWRLTRLGSIVIAHGSASERGEAPYDTWIRVFDEMPSRDRALHEARLASLRLRPLVSVFLLLDDASTVHRVVRALIDQIYPHWEIAVAAPAAVHDELRSALSAEGLAATGYRLIEATPDSADSFNALLADTRSDFVLVLPRSMVLRPHALLEVALSVQRHPQTSLIYADDDQLNNDGRRQSPTFKPAWSPELLDAWDYVGYPRGIRTETLREVGGWRSGESDPHYDLLLRIGRTVASSRIVHLAKILAHRPAEAAPSTSVKRRVYAVPEPAPFVSLIIPTRDSADMLETCIRSLRARAKYPNHEILVVDNGSVEEATKRLFERLISESGVRVLPRPGPFNFSALNNSAVAEAKGEIVALVNNDIEAMENGWLDEMAALASRPEIGCVGARLLYPDGTLQHGGIVVGLGGVAGHAHRLAPPTEPGYLRRLRAVHDVTANTAACLVVRKRVYEQVGGLDERLTVAFNDVDFCLKVREAGYRNLWTPFATLIHYESVSRGRDYTPAKARRFAEEYATMQQRWGARLSYDPYYSPNLTYDRQDFSVRVR